jgi:hypothetical protein
MIYGTAWVGAWFAGTIAEQLMTYALDDVEYTPAIRQITADAARNNYRWLSLIFGIVPRTPFQTVP